MKTAIIIPARYASSRLPGKPLLRQTGKYLIQHVYERALRARRASQVLVATDDLRIAAAVEGFGGQAVLTSRRHPTGTDRVAEVARNLDADVIINLVGILFERGKQRFSSVQAEGAGLVAETAAESGARMIHVSAIGADPGSESLYARSKAEGEQAVWAATPAATASLIRMPVLLSGLRRGSGRPPALSASRSPGDHGTEVLGPEEVGVDVDVVVEIPKGSRNKYEWDPAVDRIRLDRMLFTATGYPGDYGFVPDTLAEDGDPIDVLLLIDEPTFPGCVVNARIIAVYWMRDEAGHIFGSALLLLSAFWHQARSAIVRTLPEGLRGRLPVLDRSSVSQLAA